MQSYILHYSENISVTILLHFKCESISVNENIIKSSFLLNTYYFIKSTHTEIRIIVVKINNSQSTILCKDTKIFIETSETPSPIPLYRES